MPRTSDSLTQRQRTRANPLVLGSFSQTSVRYLKGSLGPQNKIIGRADTNQTSNGGFGGGSYNHWFQINLEVPAWIIIAKGPPRPKYIQVSAYDLDFNPIQGRSIFDADSIQVTQDGLVYHPYVGHVMNAQSDLYNFYDPKRLDKGDERYFPLANGSYVICISTTRNEPLEYSVALVVETADLNPILLLEDYSKLLFEDMSIEDSILCDKTEDYTGLDSHDHSLSEWQAAWNRDHKQGTPFPEVLVPLTTKP